jgi:hypothetical protein
MGSFIGASFEDLPRPERPLLQGADNALFTFMNVQGGVAYVATLLLSHKLNDW